MDAWMGYACMAQCADPPSIVCCLTLLCLSAHTRSPCQCLRVMSDLESVTEPTLLRPSRRLVNGKTGTDKFFAEAASKHATAVA
eukprot:m.101136 g.101136  ORF g.101136 m.101136 type:complete len:84 (+) comp10376_c0_seq1:107-358(+)